MKSSERGNYFAKGHTAVYSRATIWIRISWLQDQPLYCTFLIFFFLVLIYSHPPFFQLPVVISLKWKYRLLVIVLVTFSLYFLPSNSIANNKRNKCYMASTWTNQESHHYQKPQNMKYMPHCEIFPRNREHSHSICSTLAFQYDLKVHQNQFSASLEVSNDLWLASWELETTMVMEKHVLRENHVDKLVLTSSLLPSEG